MKVSGPVVMRAYPNVRGVSVILMGDEHYSRAGSCPSGVEATEFIDAFLRSGTEGDEVDVFVEMAPEGANELAKFVGSDGVHASQPLIRALRDLVVSGCLDRKTTRICRNKYPYGRVHGVDYRHFKGSREAVAFSFEGLQRSMQKLVERYYNEYQSAVLPVTKDAAKNLLEQLDAMPTLTVAKKRALGLARLQKQLKELDPDIRGVVYDWSKKHLSYTLNEDHTDTKRFAADVSTTKAALRKYISGDTDLLHALKLHMMNLTVDLGEFTEALRMLQMDVYTAARLFRKYRNGPPVRRALIYAGWGHTDLYEMLFRMLQPRLKIIKTTPESFRCMRLPERVPKIAFASRPFAPVPNSESDDDAPVRNSESGGVTPLHWSARVVLVVALAYLTIA